MPALTQKEHYPLGISIVIPCLNERETIQAAVREALGGIQASGLRGEVIVADNGSVDGSQQLAEATGARVVSIQSKGYGSALHGGILSARYQVVGFADADLSYPFLEIPKLIEPLLQGKAQFVLGSRLGGSIEPSAMPSLNRYVGTPILSWFIRLFYRIPTSDCNSGMRVFFTEHYPLLDLRCPGMEYASEMLIRVAQVDLKYTEVPISFRKDQRNRPPHLRRWRDGWRHLRFILGNAPSPWLILIPGGMGTFALALAFLLSYSEYLTPTHTLHYHSAFALITLSAPLLLLALTQLLIKAVRQGSGLGESPMITQLQTWCETAFLFYLSMGLYGVAILQLGWIGYKWYRLGFGNLSEMDGTIRIMVFSLFATVIFSLDLSLGLIQLFQPKDSSQ